MLIPYHFSNPRINLKQLKSENKPAIIILLFIAVRLSLHMISANVSPQGKSPHMGSLSIHPACHPLAVQRQLGMLKPERANRTLSGIHGSEAYKSLRSSREDVAVCVQEQTGSRYCFELPYANALWPFSAGLCLCTICICFVLAVLISHVLFCIPCKYYFVHCYAIKSVLLSLVMFQFKSKCRLLKSA